LSGVDFKSEAGKFGVGGRITSMRWVSVFVSWSYWQCRVLTHGH